MTAALKDLWRANFGVYGARMLWLAARRAGHEIGRDQTACLMRAAGLRGATRQRRACSTRPGPREARPGDLVGRDFSIDVPESAVVSDLTVVAGRARCQFA